MQVGGAGASGSWECSCDVCLGYSGEIAPHRADHVHEICAALFTDDSESIVPDAYASTLRQSNSQYLEEVRGAENLEFIDGEIILSNPVSCSEKFMIAFAVLLVLLIVAFVVSAIATYKGAVIPGINMETMVNVVMLVGIGLSIVSFGYSLLWLGCLVGYAAVSKARKREDVLSTAKSRLKNAARIQKRIDVSLDICFEVLQSHASYLKLAVAESDRLKARPLLALLGRHLCVSTLYRELNLGVEAMNSEIERLREFNERKKEESIVLVGINSELSDENDALLCRLLSRE